MIKGIRYYSLMGSCGYGEAAITYMKSLIKKEVQLSWSPLVNTRWGLAPRHMLPEKLQPTVGQLEAGDGEELIQCLENDIEYDTVFLHCVPELWPKLVEPGKVNIGYTVWESDRLPKHWPAALKMVDLICVPCEFNRGMFTLEQGPEVAVVPHAIIDKAGKTSDKPYRKFKKTHGISENMYVFYIIAAWDPRKAMIATVHAFLQSFNAHDDVCLLVKTDDMGVDDRTGKRMPVSEIIDAIVSGYPAAAKIVLIAGRIAEEEIKLIHQTGDCFFSLTHSEGWGLGAFEAAVSANPVIITGWGGQLDFLPDEISYRVKYKLKPISRVPGWESYEATHHWAVADTEHARELLQHVFSNRLEAKKQGSQLQAYVKCNFSIEKISQELISVIDGAHAK